MTNYTYRFLDLNVLVRLLLWLAAVSLISLVFFRGFWADLPHTLSPGFVFGEHQASPWGVLALCGIFLCLKRKEIWSRMILAPNIFMLPMGLLLVVVALLPTYPPDYAAFKIILAWLGVFLILFSAAARIPAVLLAIYGFTISFPLLIDRIAGNFYAVTALLPLQGLMTLFHFPFATDGQTIHLLTLTKENLSVMVTTACAGPATMAVFISLFILMTLDMPLPPRRAIWLFLFGVAGTWMQSLIRLVVLMVVAYYFGESAMWQVHFWSIYVLFPLWYLLFVYIYFRQFENTKVFSVQTN